MITRVSVVPRRIPIADEFPVSYESHAATEHVFVRIETDAGEVGIGEGTALPWFTGETAGGMAAFLEDWVRPEVEGLSLAEARGSIRELRSSFPGNPGGKTAIDMALADLRAKRDGVPLRDLLGPTVRDELPLVYPVPGVDPDRAAALVENGLDEGYRHFKIKATGDIETDVERIDAALARLPADASARIDANTGWERYPTAKRAIDLIERPERIEYLEQPVAADRPEDLRRLWYETGIPVFADEAAHTASDVEHLGREGLVSGCQLKLAKTGSLEGLYRIAETANRYGMAATPVSAFGTSIEASAILHLTATLPNLASTPELDPALIAADPVTEPLRADPTVPVPDGPGIGVTPEPDLFGECP